MKQSEKIVSKIFTLDRLNQLRLRWRNEGKRVVFTNGCFDIIHRGHIDYLGKAADMGDKLIVAVNSDSSVKKLKGSHRPLQDEITRLMVLASMQFVDAVFLFDEETPFKVISILVPDVLVKGGDYSEENMVGADIVKNNNGQVVVIPFLEGFSTTSIEEKIRNSSKKD